MPSASAGRWRRSRTSAAFAIALAAGCSMACLHSIGNRDVSDDVSANAFSFAGTAIRLERPGSSPQRLAGNRESMSRGESDTQVAMSALAPAAASMSLPLWKRLPVDLMAHITAPIRAYKLAAITKEIVADIKEKFASKKSTSGKSSSAGGAAETLTTLIPQYMKGHVIARTSPEEYKRVLSTSLNLILDAVLADEPYPFEPYHKAIREPLDHYTWGNDFFRSMIKYRGSRLEGLEYLLEIKESLAKGDNVICLANHQTEADPQVLSILCELEGHEDLAEKTIFLAGHKVTTDPLAIPFSKGRNLLTIFSKKYLDKMEAEELEEATVRNRQTVAEWQRLLKEGGHISGSLLLVAATARVNQAILSQRSLTHRPWACSTSSLRRQQGVVGQRPTFTHWRCGLMVWCRHLTMPRPPLESQETQSAPLSASNLERRWFQMIWVVRRLSQVPLRK